MTASETDLSRNHKLTLILGVDGSGKTTVANALAMKTGAIVYEATKSSFTRALKKKHLRRQVDAQLVHEREYMYMALTRLFQKEILHRLEKVNVMTTSSTLVTRLANYSIRDVILEPPSASLSDIIDEWLNSDRLPDEIIFLYAPKDVIVRRVFERLRDGDIHEFPRAYNSPFYLGEYSKVLEQAARQIAEKTSVPFYSYDTSAMTVGQITQDYYASQVSA